MSNIFNTLKNSKFVKVLLVSAAFLPFTSQVEAAPAASAKSKPTLTQRLLRQGKSKSSKTGASARLGLKRNLFEKVTSAKTRGVLKKVAPVRTRGVLKEVAPVRTRGALKKVTSAKTRGVLKKVAPVRTRGVLRKAPL